MSKRGSGAVEIPVAPNFFAYVFDPECFMVGTLDPKNFASGVSPSNTLQSISSESMPDPMGEPDRFRGVADDVLFPYVSELTELVFQRITGDKTNCLLEDDFEKMFDKHLSEASGYSFTDLPRGCAIVRSSSQWSISEAEAQRGRLRAVFLEMLERGFVPAMAVADSESGTVTLRAGLLLAVGAAMESRIDGAFIHTMERFSRSELDGLLMLVLIQWLTGNVFFLSSKFNIFVEFDTTDRRSMLLAAEEIIEGAREGSRIRERFRRGSRAVLERGKQYYATMGRRMFHGGSRDD